MTVLEALIELQDVDGRIRELELELKDLPRRKALETARLNGVSADLRAAQAEQSYAEQRVKDFEADREALDAKINELKRTQMGLKTNKEFQQFAVQISLVERDRDASDANAKAVQEDEVKAAAIRLKAAQDRFAAEKVGVDSFCAEIDERTRLVEEELAGCRAERAVKAGEITDPRFMLYYERLRTKRWPVVVPLTHDGVCDGCHLVQPPSVAQLADANARRGAEGGAQAIVACTMCGRILYR